jgi:hypothetical protein
MQYYEKSCSFYKGQCIRRGRNFFINVAYKSIANAKRNLLSAVKEALIQICRKKPEIYLEEAENGDEAILVPRQFIGWSAQLD